MNARAAFRIKPSFCDIHFDPGPHFSQYSRKTEPEIIDGRGKESVGGAAFEDHCHGFFGKECREQEQLEHEGNAARGGNSDRKLSSFDGTGKKPDIHAPRFTPSSRPPQRRVNACNPRRCCVARPGFGRFLRILKILQARPVAAQIAAVVRMICPPPSRYEPSISIMSDGTWFSAHAGVGVLPGLIGSGGEQSGQFLQEFRR